MAGQSKSKGKLSKDLEAAQTPKIDSQPVQRGLPGLGEDKAITLRRQLVLSPS